jgi:hypothetical protein
VGCVIFAQSPDENAITISHICNYDHKLHLVCLMTLTNGGRMLLAARADVSAPDKEQNPENN